MTVELAWTGFGSAVAPLAAAVRSAHCRGVRVARAEGDAGTWCRLTWRGVRTLSAALAPGRFAAALHQPPLAATLRFGWRRAALRDGLPSLDQRLDEVFGTCADLEAAIERLAAHPVAQPALLVLAGAGPCAGAVLDWSDGFLSVHRAPVCLGMPGADHRAAAAVGGARLAAAAGGVAWLHARVDGTRSQRLAVSVNAVTGLVTVQAIQGSRATTSTLHLPA